VRLGLGLWSAFVRREFHKLYYAAGFEGGTWNDTRWFGVKAQKCPLDLWVYQEILVERHPDVIIETGTAEGGSALFLASLCELAGHGRVITVDVREPPAVPHPRIDYVTGSSTDPATFEQVRGRIRADERVMVILDSDHTRDHVREELDLYGGLVSPGQYLVVEDTNLGGHPVLPRNGPGPMEAVDDFLQARTEFSRDPKREKFLLTMNPRGYLVRSG
jgi:cephalosporin hydroxylase